MALVGIWSVWCHHSPSQYYGTCSWWCDNMEIGRTGKLSSQQPTYPPLFSIIHASRLPYSKFHSILWKEIQCTLSYFTYNETRSRGTHYRRQILFNFSLALIIILLLLHHSYFPRQIQIVITIYLSLCHPINMKCEACSRSGDCPSAAAAAGRIEDRSW